MKEASREIYQTNMETGKTSCVDRYKFYYISMIKAQRENITAKAL